MAEELALDQRGRQRCTVHLDQRAIGAAAVRVDRAREQLLASAGFPEQQHGGGRGRDARSEFDGRADRRAGAADLLEGSVPANRFTQVPVLGFEVPLELSQLGNALPELQFDVPAVHGVGQDLPEDAQALDVRVAPGAIHRCRRGQQRTHPATADEQRHRDVREHRKLRDVGALGDGLGRDLVRQSLVTQGLAATQSLVIPGQQRGCRRPGGDALEASTRQRMTDRDDAVLRAHLQQRAAIRLEVVEHDAECALDLRVDAFGRDAGDARGDVAEQTSKARSGIHVRGC